MDGMNPAAYQPHALHTAERHWPQTNCYIDLWVELLHARGLDPLAALGVAVAQDYEGDQFTFTKIPAEDIEILYGLATQELSIYDRLEGQIAAQAARGRIVLVEVDGMFLPDTRGLTYRTEHGKTTIGVRRIDPAARRLEYFHNSGMHVLDGADYDGLFAVDAVLPPYVEFVAPRGEALHGEALREAARARLRTHLRRRPRANPVAAWRAEFPAQLEALFTRPPGFFHQVAFNLPRQLGMNWELLGSHLAWLDGDGCGAAIVACDRIAADAKALQFRMARLVSRRRVDPCDDLFDGLQAAHDAILGDLVPRFS